MSDVIALLQNASFVTTLVTLLAPASACGTRAAAAALGAASASSASTSAPASR